MKVSLEQHRKNLEAIAKLLTDEGQCALVIAPDDASLQDSIEQQRKKTQDKFYVLIVGTFNAGKSSMVNAFAGREFLPTGNLPETGVITEIIYGTSPRITLYPKPGIGDGKPIVLDNPTVETVKSYCSIDNQAMLEGANTESIPYERTVVECDLPLLKEGIVLIDSVGMNDPWGNDYITERYFPRADAIIYLMDAGQAYTVSDRRLLTQINENGFRDLIIAYTKYDSVLSDYTRRPQAALEEFCDTMRKFAARHTDIGDDGIHFIDSIKGLEGKETGDQEMVVRSGIHGLEEFCYRYLVENKGAVKIRTLNGAMKKAASDLIDRAQKVIAGANMDLDVLNARIAAANEELAQAEQQAAAIVANFRRHVESGMPLIEAAVTTHVSQLANKVDLEDYDFHTELPHGPQAMIPGRANKMANALRDECFDAMLQRMTMANKQWISSDLQRQVQALITDSVEDLGSDLSGFYELIDQIDATLAGETKKQTAKRTVSDVVTGVAYTLLTGDFLTGSTAVLYGKGTLGKVVVAQAAVGLGVGLLAAAMGAPITFPVLLAAALIADIFAILTGNSKKKSEKVRQEALKQLRDAYDKNTDGQAETVRKIIGGVRSMLDQSCENLETMQRLELEKKRREIEAMLDVNQKDASQKKQIAQEAEAKIAELKELVELGAQIAAQYN